MNGWNLRLRCEDTLLSCLLQRRCHGGIISARGSHQERYRVPALHLAQRPVNKQESLSLPSAESQPRIICCDAPSDLHRNLDRLPSVYSPQVQVHQGFPQWVQHSSHPETVSPSHGNGRAGPGLQGRTGNRDGGTIGIETKKACSHSCRTRKLTAIAMCTLWNQQPL